MNLTTIIMSNGVKLQNFYSVENFVFHIRLERFARLEITGQGRKQRENL